MPSSVQSASLNVETPLPGVETLDPPDWESFRSQAHRMLDDMIDYTRDIRQRPVWQPIPDEIRERFRSSLPAGRSTLAEVHQEFMRNILPYAAGNVHPGFMGWVHGGGTPVGILAELLAAGLNANLGGRNQIPIEVERQVARWVQELLGFPEGAGGLFVTGTSMANFVAVVIARDAALGQEVRCQGIGANSPRLTAYASREVHGCLSKALDLCGLGSSALRLIPTGPCHRIQLEALEKAVQEDRQSGFQPFLVVGTAGTVDTGAVDDLAGLADVARREKLWFHVDGAYGALAMLAPELAPKLRGIELADSVAMDFHKWGQVPYDAGFILVRDRERQRSAFAASNAYLRRETRGLAAGSPWPCDLGPDLSRGFRALKTWFTFKVYGAEALGSVISRSCTLARYLESRIAATPQLELLAPVELNIACFRYRAEDADGVNAQIVVELQESGSVAPSTTVIDGHLAIRAAIVNHRTGQHEVDALIERTLALGSKILAKRSTPQAAAPRLAAPHALPSEIWEAELHELEKRLADGSDSVELRFRHASLLAELGSLGGATNEFLRVLERQPHHRTALNSLGHVLMATGHRSAARIVFQDAVTHHPSDALSRVNLGNFLLQEGEWLAANDRSKEAQRCQSEALEHFEQALRAHPGFDRAHEGLSYVFSGMGDAEKAAWHRREAFRKRAIMPLPFRGRRAPVPVLHLASTTGGNVRLKSFLDNRIFQTFIVLPEFVDPQVPLPAHQLVINAIGDAELGERALVSAQSMLNLTTAPVINSPTAVLATTRANNARRFSGIPGVVTPITATVCRDQLRPQEAIATLADFGLEFPILVRTPGFHTGINFLKVETLDALPAALAELPGPEVIVMQYLDARGPDGKSRKYRAMMIGGKLYPLHVAISSRWKIHYFTAEMAENPAHRAEDAAFLENMPRVLGPVAMNALEQIRSVVSLDYGGIDFGLGPRGEVLLFEVNATMVVNPPDPDHRWDYRWPAYRTIRAAVQKMLIERARPFGAGEDTPCVAATRFLSAASAGV